MQWGAKRVLYLPHQSCRIFRPKGQADEVGHARALFGLAAYESHSQNILLVAQAGSAADSDHNLDAPIVHKVSSNVHDHVGHIKRPGVRNQVIPGVSGDGSGTLRGAI
eukprot:6192015-Pleurochrysis_carterae.AAC.1